MAVAQGILAAYAWLIIGVLLVFMGRIAFFYERTSNQQVGYRLYIIPALFLAAGVVWYLVHDVGFIGQPIGDALLFFGGILTTILAVRLRELMTGERR